MPRDIGTGIYHYPDGTPGNPAQTIFSTRYNTFINDLTNVLNQPVPPNMGGTGGASAEEGHVKSSTEAAAQLVTDYNTHLFYPGSFRSAATAGLPGAPVDNHSFAGICYLNEALAYPPTNQNLIIEARDQDDVNSPGILYIREKKENVWGPWMQSADISALAFQGMQVNGGFEINQEKASGQFAFADGEHVCDMWKLFHSVLTGGAGMAQFSSGSAFSRFPFSMAGAVTGAQPTMSASDYFFITQMVEGNRMSRLGWGKSIAIPITLTFWTAHSKTGLYSGSIRNAALDRCYAFTYTQAASGVEQLNTIVIPGETAGTWATDTGIGMWVSFVIAAGPLLLVEPNTWLAAGLGATGQVNGLDNVSNVFRFAGLAILPGAQTITPSQSPLLMRQYDQELATCQRYFQKSYPQGIIPGTVNHNPGLTIHATPSNAIPDGRYYGSVQLFPTMRITPLVKIYGFGGTPDVVSDFQGLELAAGSGTPDTRGTSAFSVRNNSGLDLGTQGNIVVHHWTADARL
jgi:hypothetical protein